VTRDQHAWAQALAPDVVAYSPVISRPFRGREEVAEVYGVLFEVFGDVHFTDELRGGAAHAYHWRGEIGGRTIEGNDLLRYGDDGLIREIRISIRPLVDIGVFAAAAGPPLARLRGPVNALVLRVLTVPLTLMLSAVDALAPRLAQRR
jgi:hypothetical protein